MFLLFVNLFGFHGVIEADTTWSDTAYLTGDVWVNSGVTLTINPGTVVLYADSCEWDTAWYAEGESYRRTEEERIDLIVEGNLKAIGAVEDSIYFYSEDAQDKGRGTIILANGLDSLGYCSIPIDYGYEWSFHPYMFVENSMAEISNCLFVKGAGIEGVTSSFSLNQCEFDSIFSHPVRLEGGLLRIESCSFVETRSVGGYMSWGGVVEAIELDTCVVDAITVSEAEGYRSRLYGGHAAGCLYSGCNYVEVTNSTFEYIEGGRGETGAGAGGMGGDGCGLYFEDCDYVLAFDNIIDHVSGGWGEENIEDPGRGGDGIGVYLKGCADVSIDSNQIYSVYGGIGEFGTDGTSYPLLCLNSDPDITNNEFKSVGIHISIDSTSQPIIGGAPDLANRFLNLAQKKDYVIYNDSPYDIDATWNFWECSPSMIDSLIFDYYDDPTKGIVHYDNFTDVEEKESLTQPFTLRSNLVKDVLYVSLSRGYTGGEVQLSLFDASGRRVLSKPINGSEIEVDVSNFPRGVYFLSVNIPEKPRITRKVILN